MEPDPMSRRERLDAIGREDAESSERSRRSHPVGWLRTVFGPTYEQRSESDRREIIRLLKFVAFGALMTTAGVWLGIVILVMRLK